MLGKFASHNFWENVLMLSNQSGEWNYYHKVDYNQLREYNYTNAILYSRLNRQH